jgi:hypothetical protein
VYLDNNLSLNVIKTKELNVYYRKRREEHAPIYINRAVHITNKLSWSKHTKTVVKRARQHLGYTVATFFKMLCYGK